MLKKISHILMVIVLLITTTGMTVSKHYCSESLVNVNIFSEAKSCCEGGCSTDCCHNESERYELNEEFVLAISNIEFQEVIIELILPFIQSFVINEVEIQNFELSNFNAPPPPGVLDLLSDIQVYRL
ncbi:MAG: hypothetical protein N4A74_08335 [Carboxylicivirga sp.]|jgi:hypothetical protein|nr:hypothetical protein [Carboxylicivirga sp.]